MHAKLRRRARGGAARAARPDVQYVPTHLHYILMELLKNSMRATMEHHEGKDNMPPIRLVIADGEANEDVVIKVSDEGAASRAATWAASVSNH